MEGQFIIEPSEVELLPKKLSPCGAETKKEDDTLEETSIDPPSFKEIFTNPLNHVTILCYFGCAVTGLTFTIMALAKVNIGWYAPLILMLTGGHACYEIRLLTSMKREMIKLDEMTKDLHHNIGELDSEVTTFDTRNKELGSQTKEFDTRNKELAQNAAELEALQSSLLESSEGLKSNVQNLNNQVESIKKANKTARANLKKLTMQANSLESEYKQFQELKLQLSKYATENGLALTESLEQQKEMFNKLNRAMKENASTLLSQLATDMEFRDTEEGMNNEEFDGWMERMPERFQSKLAEKNITFQTFAGTDLLMDFKESQFLIDALLNDETTDFIEKRSSSILESSI